MVYRLTLRLGSLPPLERMKLIRGWRLLALLVYSVRSEVGQSKVSMDQYVTLQLVQQVVELKYLQAVLKLRLGSKAEEPGSSQAANQEHLEGSGHHDCCYHRERCDQSSWEFTADIDASVAS